MTVSLVHGDSVITVDESTDQLLGRAMVVNDPSGMRPFHVRTFPASDVARAIRIACSVADGFGGRIIVLASLDNIFASHLPKDLHTLHEESLPHELVLFVGRSGCAQSITVHVPVSTHHRSTNIDQSSRLATTMIMSVGAIEVGTNHESLR